MVQVLVFNPQSQETFTFSTDAEAQKYIDSQASTDPTKKPAQLTKTIISEEDVIEDVLDEAQYGEFQTQKAKQFETEITQKTQQKQQELQQKQEIERKKSTIREKLAGAIGFVSGISQTLQTKRLERYEQRQKQAKEKAQTELETEYQTIKQKTEKEIEEAKPQFIKPTKTGTRTTTTVQTIQPAYVEEIKTEMPTLAPKPESKVTTSYYSTKPAVGFIESGMSFEEYTKYVKDLQKQYKESKEPTKTETKPTTLTLVPTKTLTAQDYIKATQIDRSDIMLTPSFEKTPSGFVAPVLGVKTTQELKEYSQTPQELTYKTDLKEFQKNLEKTQYQILYTQTGTEVAMSEKFKSTTDTLSSFSELINPMKESNIIVAGIKTIPYIPVVASTVVGRIGQIGFGGAEQIGYTLKDYYELPTIGKGTLQEYASDKAFQPENYVKKTLAIPSVLTGVGIKTAGSVVGAVGYEVATLFPTTKSIIGSTFESLVTNPIKFSVESATVGKLTSPIFKPIGKALTPVTAPISKQVARVTTPVAIKFKKLVEPKIIPSSVKTIVGEVRSPMLGVDDAFTVTGEGGVLFKTQSKLGAYLYKETGLSRFAPKSYVSNVKYDFDVKVVQEAMKNPFKLQTTGVIDETGVTGYLVGKSEGLTFGKTPKIFKGSPFSSYGDQLTEEAFEKLAMKKLDLYSSFKSRSMFETTGTIKTSLTSKGIKISDDVLTLKTTSDVYAPMVKNIKVSYAKQFIDSPIISKFKAGLGVVEETGTAKIKLTGSIVEGEGIKSPIVGSAKQVIRLEDKTQGYTSVVFSQVPKQSFIKEGILDLKRSKFVRYFSTEADLGERNVLEWIIDKRTPPQGTFELIRQKPSLLTNVQRKVEPTLFKLKNLKEYVSLRTEVGFSEKDAIFNIKTQQAVMKSIKAKYPKGIPIDNTLRDTQGQIITENILKQPTTKLATETTTKIVPTIKQAQLPTTPTITKQTIQQATKTIPQPTITIPQTPTTMPFRVKQEQVARLQVKQPEVKQIQLEKIIYGLPQREKIIFGQSEKRIYQDFQKMYDPQAQKISTIQSTKNLTKISTNLKVGQKILDGTTTRLLQRNLINQSMKQSQKQIQDQALKQLTSTKQALKTTSVVTTKIKPIVPTKPIIFIKPVLPFKPKTQTQTVKQFGRISTKRSRKTKPVFQLKSDLYRKFATSEKDIEITQETTKLRDILWKRQGSFSAFIPTKQLLNRNYINRIGFNKGVKWTP